MSKKAKVIIENPDVFGAKYPYLMKPNDGKIISVLRAGVPLEGAKLEELSVDDLGVSLPVTTIASGAESDKAVSQAVVEEKSKESGLPFIKNKGHTEETKKAATA